MSTDINIQTIEYSPFFEIRHRNKTTSRQKKNGTLFFTSFFSDKSRYSILPFLQEARRVLELGGVLIFSTESMSEAEASNAGSLGTIERASEHFAHSRHEFGMGSGRMVVGLNC